MLPVRARARHARAAVPGQPGAAGLPPLGGRAPRRRARCAIPAGTRAPTPRGSGALLPAIARRAQRVITVSEFSRARAGASCSGVEAAVRRPGGVDDALLAGRRPGARAPRAGLAAPVRADASPATRRARTSARSCPRRARSRARASTSWSPAATGRSSRAEDGLDALRLLGHVDDALLPGLYAGAQAFALPSLLRGLRAAGARGDGVPERRSWPPTPARCRRRAAARRVLADARRARRSRPRSPGCSATRRARAPARRRPGPRRRFPWDATAAASTRCSPEMADSMACVPAWPRGRCAGGCAGRGISPI